MEVYDKGLDFVDIVGTPDYVQDFVGVEFLPDYFCKGERKAEDMFIEEEEGYDPQPQSPQLSDDELNQLLDI